MSLAVFDHKVAASADPTQIVGPFKALLPFDRLPERVNIYVATSVGPQRICLTAPDVRDGAAESVRVQVFDSRLSVSNDAGSIAVHVGTTRVAIREFRAAPLPVDVLRPHFDRPRPLVERLVTVDTTAQHFAVSHVDPTLSRISTLLPTPEWDKFRNEAPRALTVLLAARILRTPLLRGVEDADLNGALQFAYDAVVSGKPVDPVLLDRAQKKWADISLPDLRAWVTPAP